MSAGPFLDHDDYPPIASPISIDLAQSSQSLDSACRERSNALCARRQKTPPIATCFRIGYAR
jgi:hypothetical protein